MMRVVLILVVLFVVYRIVKKLTFSGGNGLGDHEGGEERSRETELVQDPQCGTYFLPKSGVTAVVHGRKVYFCSESCRAAYLENSTESKDYGA
ncbi:MAG: hypothetical protein KBH99_08210 [Syntrophobacteraceae bacterium]|nr:hypothetical protein [Syntrophobacteraceae bacterium]